MPYLLPFVCETIAFMHNNTMEGVKHQYDVCMHRKTTKFFQHKNAVATLICVLMCVTAFVTETDRTFKERTRTPRSIIHDESSWTLYIL